MSNEMSCEQVREVAAELAIGIADGQDRDAALRHAATCNECRGLVADLSGVVDDLLLLAPAHEPPVGFRSRTVNRLVERPPRRIRWRPVLAAAASFVLAIVVGSAAMYLASADERRLADSYRAVLAQGQGSFFVAAPLQGPDGTIGTVYGYQGSPSWLFATVRGPAAGTQRYQVRLTTKSGQQLTIGSATLGGTHNSWGAALPVGLIDVAELRLQADDGSGDLVAEINATDPWS